MVQDLIKEIRQTPGLFCLNDPKIKNGRYIIYADASNTVMGGLISVKDDKNVEHPVAFHSRTFPDQYNLKHINVLEALAMSMVVRKFKGYISDQKPTLVTDSQYVKRIMEMDGKKLEHLPSNVFRWIQDMKEETSFTKDSTVNLVPSNKNPADLSTCFTAQIDCDYEDAPWSNAGFDITGKYVGGHSEMDCLRPDYPNSLVLMGLSPLLQLIAQELGQEVPSLRKQLSDKLRLEFKKSKENLEALYGEAKTKDADMYIRVIEAKD
jgi:hypothetical protein